MSTSALKSPLPEAPRFPFARTCPIHPPPLYAQARTEQPVYKVTLWDDRKAWLILDYALVKQVLTDPRFSGRFSHPQFPAVTQARVAIDKQERAFIGMDNPEHDAYRRLFTREFSAKRMLALRPQITELTNRLIDEMLAQGPSADLVESLAVRLPSLVMCELFGSPYEDHVFIMRCAAGRHGLTQSAETAQQSARELVAYMRRLIDQKEKEPGDDMVSRIIADHVLTGALSREDFAEIGAMILRGGHDTTTNMIGVGTYLLLQNPPLREKLAGSPDLMAGAIEEMLRFVSPVQFAPRRVALEDVEMGGVLIRQGEGVFPLLPAANRDACAFADPDTLDFDRDASGHLAFGYGIHQCLGQILARVELQVVFSALLQRIPTLRLAVPPEQIRFKSDMQIYGIYSLPVAW